MRSCECPFREPVPGIVTWDAEYRVCKATALAEGDRVLVSMTFDHLEPVLDPLIRLEIEVAADVAVRSVLDAG